MKVLQLGPKDWSKIYSIPKELDWHFNDFPASKVIDIGEKNTKRRNRSYAVVILTGQPDFTKKEWDLLHREVSPYTVLYLKEVKDQLDEEGQYFLKCLAAEEIKEDPQELINHLSVRYFVGQSGIRIFPTNLSINDDLISQYKYLDAGHLQTYVNTDDEWRTLACYRQGLYIDPGRIMKIWLEFKKRNLKIRLRLFVRNMGEDGAIEKNYVLNIDSSTDEQILPIPVSDQIRFATANIEVKGSGQIVIGVLHSRWYREGKGEFFPGGKRIVNLTNREDIAYYFNPGDLKPPLNVYFSGARALEGFEAFPLFKSLHAPALLFTDMRLSDGQFYTDSFNYMGQQIQGIIKDTLHALNFTTAQLIMNGISMGTYPALRYGAQLGAHVINVAKPLGNLGYIADRGRLQRPDEFDTIFDIDDQLVEKLDSEHLKKLDDNFWQEFNQTDLSHTRLFVGYMKNDDYDNHAIEDLKRSPAVQKAYQFSYRGFAGRHNDDPSVNEWFIARLREVLKHEFKRKL